MTHFDYIIKHLLPSWVQQWTHNFKIWADLVTGSYDGYALLEDDDPYEECYGWFWTCINMDETYSKEYLEFLTELAKEVETGGVRTYSAKEVLELLRQKVEDCKDNE